MDYIFEKFLRFDEKLVLIDDNKEFTYKDLSNKIDEFYLIIKDKIETSAVVAILGDYSLENIALLFALYKNKNIVVPITTEVKKLQDEYIKESLSNYTVSFNINLEIKSLDNNTSHKMINSLKEKKQAGLVLFSSGSTGKAKAMIHNLNTLMLSYKDKKEKSMNMLIFLMFDHIGGLNTLFNALCMGSTLIVPKNREAKTICCLIQDYKIRILPSSPTFLNLILISGEYLNYDLKSLRMISYGTETMPESLLLKLKDIFPKVKFLQTFGTSETGILITSSKSSQSLYMKLEDKNIEYKIVNDELYLRSHTQVLGYLNASMDSFTSDGWFKTGDLVEVIENNYLKIIGRSKEVINVGGEKVLPAEVESVILNMNDIDDCMAYSQENSITGQSVAIDVVTSAALSSRELKKEIRAYCKDKLENFKIPTKVNIVQKTNFSDRFKKIRIKK